MKVAKTKPKTYDSRDLLVAGHFAKTALLSIPIVICQQPNLELLSCEETVISLLLYMIARN